MEGTEHGVGGEAGGLPVPEAGSPCLPRLQQSKVDLEQRAQPCPSVEGLACLLSARLCPRRQV